MKTQEFKQKYFTNNFYWVNKDNYRALQEIAIEIGCLCHNGKKEIIEWHEGFKNLGFRTYSKNNNVTVFQKEPFLLHNQTATDFNEMLIEYSNLSSFCVNKLDNNINLEIYKEQDTDSHLPKKQREVSEEELIRLGNEYAEKFSE